jgi:molybdopterin/thiamine biosynthesis adenylyltransferase
MTSRYARQTALFGEQGQRRIAASHVVLAGAGGLGMPVLQQLAYLGVLRYTTADTDIVDQTSLNRLVGALPGDLGKLKVGIAQQMILAIQPAAEVTALDKDVPDPAVLAAVAEATVVIGAFDRETPRLAPTDACSSAGVPYVDLASEVHRTDTGPVYGGRIVVAGDGHGCLSCLGLIDHVELAREAMNDDQRRVHDEIYGIRRDELAGSGPAVVTINSVVASLAATEVMCLLTGLRPPVRQMTYRGDLGSVRPSSDVGQTGCPYCARWREANSLRAPGPAA